MMPFYRHPLSKVILEYTDGSRFEIAGEQILHADIEKPWNGPPILHIDVLAVYHDEPQLEQGPRRLPRRQGGS